RQRRVQRPGTGIVEDDLDLRVRLVEGGELAQGVEVAPGLVEGRDPLAGPGPGGQPADRPVGELDRLLAAAQRPFHGAAVWEGPGGHGDVRATGVAQRVGREVLADVLVELAEAQWVGDAGGDLEVVGRAVLRGCRRGGEDGVDDEVDG